MAAPRLHTGLLHQLDGVTRPAYDRQNITPGHLHIGVGGFHRAHQAVFTEAVLNNGSTDWGIIGASLRTATAAGQLNPQDGLYTLTTKSNGTATRTIMGAIVRVITALDDGFDDLLTVMCDPHIHIISITVTEKGYCHTNGQLDMAHPDVQHDLEQKHSPRSLSGILAAGLAARRHAGSGPVTLLSCDNLAHNGQVLAAVVTTFLQHTDPDTAQWTKQNVTFPCSMVDRIVPFTRPEDHTALLDTAGYMDAGLVVCEPFKQWIIEDHFAGPRPPWEQAGALFVTDVQPYETAKLRLLNGPHSACAYLGLLAGCEHVHEVMANDTLRRFIEQLVAQEIIPAVTAPQGLDLDSYSASIFDRLANPDIAYGTRQVGTDGSQKLPQRLVPVALNRLAANQPMPQLAIVFAAWLEHLQNPAPDPLSDQLTSLYQQHAQPYDLVAAVFNQTPVFSALAGHQDQFVNTVANALGQLRKEGLAAVLDAHCAAG